jgi:cell division protein FtsB
MSNEPSGNDDDFAMAVKNAVVIAFLGLFSWHLYTLHNIAASVEVLIERVSTSNSRIERLENEVFFKEQNNGAKENTNP